MSIGLVESCRQIGGETACERRFYISSKSPPEGKSFAQTVRQGNTAENFPILRRIAMNLLERDGSKLNMKAKRKLSGISPSSAMSLPCNGF